MMRTRVIESLHKVDPGDWNALLEDSNPFVRHEFLVALEDSGCASAETGWHACHVLCESESGELLGALPLYLKTNSYGEFVFDFAWANAYQRAGLEYYPKLVSAVPFTPAAGPRLLTRATQAHEIKTALLARALELATANNASSFHLLFPNDQDRDAAVNAAMLSRKDCQFHWHNRDYRDFDDFLQEFTAVKRKKTKRERRRIKETGIHFRILDGHQLDEERWQLIMPVYESTFLRRGREPYINLNFFLQVSRTMPDNIVVFMGYQEAELVSVAICFRSATTLYGRYWGASRFIDSLHFETCYYQGIDYCIAENIQVFEPGTQGEHKLSRGFVPSETWSAHWLSHPQFSAAVDDYLAQERDHVERYIEVLGEHIPYKRADG